METYIREMKDNDWEAVSKIYKQGLEEGTSTFTTTCPTYDKWNKNHLSQCRYIVEYGNKIIGWCAISPTSSVDAYRGVVEVSIYIDKQFRGNGIGTKLLKHLVLKTEEAGFWTLYSSICINNISSINMHKTCGFEKIGIRSKIAKDRFGQWQDTIIMERRSSKI